MRLESFNHSALLSLLLNTVKSSDMKAVKTTRCGLGTDRQTLPEGRVNVVSCVTK